MEHSLDGAMLAESALSEALSYTPHTLSDQILDRLGKEGIAAANTSLLELLANVCEVEADVVPASSERQKSIAPGWMQPARGIRSIRLRKGATQLALPILGLAFAVHHLAATTDFTALPAPVWKIAKAFWDNLITLSPPDDDDAIAIVRALAQHGATEVLMGKGEAGLATEIIAAQCGIPGDRLAVALSRLRELGLIGVSASPEPQEPSTDAQHVWRLAL